RLLRHSRPNRGWQGAGLRNRIEKWRTGLTDVKDDYARALSGTSIIAGHSNIRRHDHGFTRPDDHWPLTFLFERECALEDIHRNGSGMSVEQGPIARLKPHRDDANFLRRVHRHARDDLLEELTRSCDTVRHVPRSLRKRRMDGERHEPQDRDDQAWRLDCSVHVFRSLEYRR